MIGIRFPGTGKNFPVCNFKPAKIIIFENLLRKSLKNNRLELFYRLKILVCLLHDNTAII
jgi:hypothetical protein